MLRNFARLWTHASHSDGVCSKIPLLCELVAHSDDTRDLFRNRTMNTESLPDHYRIPSGKLAIQHRRHAREDERAPPVHDNNNGDDEAAEAEAAAEAAMVGGSDGARAGLHARLFALLLRYKSIQGHGFQAAIGPPVWEVCRARLLELLSLFQTAIKSSGPSVKLSWVIEDDSGLTHRYPLALKVLCSPFKRL